MGGSGGSSSYRSSSVVPCPLHIERAIFLQVGLPACLQGTHLQGTYAQGTYVQGSHGWQRVTKRTKPLLVRIVARLESNAGLCRQF